MCIRDREYPGLVLLDRSLYTGQGLADLERVTAHETAHQWWYAAVSYTHLDVYKRQKDASLLLPHTIV